MWLGHVLLGFLIGTFSWNFFDVILILIFQWIPNWDVFLIRLKLAKPSFHCTITHSFLFAVIFSLIVMIFSKKLAIFAFISLLLHYLVDLPTDTGLPLLYPLKKRFSFNLWKETGHWGWKSVGGYYKQKWSLILEGIVLILLIIRLIIMS